MALKNLYVTTTLPVLNGWPQTNVVGYFCGLVRPSTLEHHHQQGRCGCFLPNEYAEFSGYVRFLQL